MRFFFRQSVKLKLFLQICYFSYESPIRAYKGCCALFHQHFPVKCELSVLIVFILLIHLSLDVNFFI